MTPTATTSTTPTPAPDCAPRTERPLRFLALGDSYTIGESVAEADRWPVQLTAMLQANGINIAEPEIIAKTGWTTAELTNGIAAAAPVAPYDLVSLLIGVNNQYRGLSEDEYRTQFVELLETAVTLADSNPNRVFVVSIPDWGVTPFANGRNREEIAAAIDAFNAINREESARLGVAYVDITETSRQALTDESLTAEDTLHPSAEMYRLWVESIHQVTCTMLK